MYHHTCIYTYIYAFNCARILRYWEIRFGDQTGPEPRRIERTFAVRATVKVLMRSPLYLEHARGTRAVPERVFLTRHASGTTLADVVLVATAVDVVVASIAVHCQCSRRAQGGRSCCDLMRGALAHARNLPMCR